MDFNSKGELLKKLRNDKGLTQEKLAEELHISRSVIAKYEIDEREPSYNNLVAYSEYFNIPISDLLNWDITPKDIIKSETKVGKWKIKILILTVLLLFIGGFIISYIVISNYTDTKVYKISTSSDDIIIHNSVLVKTKDKIYLTFANSFTNQNISYIKFYYMKDNDKKYIIQTSKTDQVYFSENINESEYLDKNDLDLLLNDSYLEITYEDSGTTTVKLDYTYDYSNADNESEIINNIEDTLNVTNDSDIFELASTILDNNDENEYTVKLENVKYNINILYKSINITYTKDKIKYKLKCFVLVNYETIELEIPSSNEIIYSYNISNEKCTLNNCENALNDIDLVRTLLEKVK